MFVRSHPSNEYEIALIEVARPPKIHHETEDHSTEHCGQKDSISSKGQILMLKSFLDN